jgi:hypothetical protein
MSAAEILHRIRYASRLAIERRRHAAGRLATPERLKHALARDLATTNWKRDLVTARRQHSTRYFPSVGAADVMRSLFTTAYKQEQSATFAHAAKVRQKHFAFFGQEFTYSGEIDWQRDPVTGRDWPAIYHADVPVHGGDVGFGDVKYVWKLDCRKSLRHRCQLVVRTRTGVQDVFVAVGVLLLGGRP